MKSITLWKVTPRTHVWTAINTAEKTQRMDRSRLSHFVMSPVGELALGGAIVVSPEDTVITAVERMRAASASCVVAVRDGHISGIFTERDVLTKCMSVDSFDWEQPLEASVLTPNPRTISPETTIADAIAIMQKHGYRTLPVTQGDEIVGLLRLGDLLREIAEAYPEEILNLPPRPNQVAESREGG